jgi:hypothetical protein
MKQHQTFYRPFSRARQFSREIAFASAITLAAVVMFLFSREPTEMASAPPVSDTVVKPQ